MLLPVPITLVFAMKILSVLSQVKFEQDSDISESKLPSLDVPPEAKCTCIPFYDCFDEESSSVINNVVHDRNNDRTVITVSQSEPGECQDILDICCYDLGQSSTTTESAKHSPQPESPSILEVSTHDITTSPPVQPQSPSSSEISQPQATISAFSLIKTETTVSQGDRNGVAGQEIVSIGSCGVRNKDGFNFTMAGFKDGQAQYGEFPWMVAVLTSAEGLGVDNLFVGGGSLIDPSVVLTAAHKIIDTNGNLTARIGEWNFAGTSEPIQTQDIPVVEIIYHPRYGNEKKIYNYALLVLERPAVLGETVGTVCLPSSPGLRFDNQECIVSGWGKNIFGEEGRYQRVMKSVTVNMLGHYQCQSAFQKTDELGINFDLDRGFVCAGDKGQDACTGDGGSPLVCLDPNSPGQYVQIGISAWGIGCGQPGIPGVYAGVAPAIGWIQEKLNTIQSQLHKVADRNILASLAKRGCHLPTATYTESCGRCIDCPECHRFNPRTCQCHRRFRCSG